ncbi:MAG: ABC transporter permease [Syntrophomonadaceae bacterium]|jgi:NitT/TauT family transport system permease protein|nr:ABC transporter permease [Syntrophomonadaceae bacterium]
MRKNDIDIIKIPKKYKQHSAVVLLKKVFASIIAILIFLALWELSARLKLVSTPAFFPPASKIFLVLGEELISGKLWPNVAISLTRSFMGFFFGLAIAIPLGLAIGWFKNFGILVNPLLQVFRNMPTLALLPVFVMFFGIGELSKVIVIMWGALWTTLLNTIAGVRSVDPQLIKAAKAMGTGSVRLFGSVVLPASLPFIFTGVRMSATFSILILIAAEMMGANSGLGYAMFFYQANFKIPQMYAYIVVMAIFGTIINFVLEAVERRSFRWRDESGTT